jgi:hypothetical protein
VVQLFFDQLVEAAAQDSVLQQAAKVNPEDKFTLVFNNMLETLLIERMEQNEEVFSRYMNDPSFQKVITGWMAEEVYRGWAESRPGQSATGNRVKPGNESWALAGGFLPVSFLIFKLLPAAGRYWPAGTHAAPNAP